MTSDTHSQDDIGHRAGGPSGGRGRLFLVTLGINVAPGGGAETLHYATRDAEALRTGFMSQVHYPLVVDVALCAHDDRQQVLNALKDVARRARPNDGLIFFYAGHGVVEARPDGETEHFLTCGGIRSTAITETALPLHDTLDALGAAACHTVLVLLDCCHSGTRGSRSFIGPVAARLLHEGRGLGPLRYEPAPGPGRCMVSASGRSKPAEETPALEHGFFSYSLLEALSQGEHETSVPISDLYARVKRRCIQLTKGRQVPVFSGTDENAHVPLFATTRL